MFNLKNSGPHPETIQLEDSAFHVDSNQGLDPEIMSTSSRKGLTSDVVRF